MNFDYGYAARVWRTEVLVKEASTRVEVMLRSFLPKGFVIDIQKIDTPQVGFPFSEHYHYTGVFHDPKPDGSDAHMSVHGYTADHVRCKMLGLILSGKTFFPFT